MLFFYDFPLCIFLLPWFKKGEITFFYNFSRKTELFLAKFLPEKIKKIFQFFTNKNNFKKWEGKNKKILILKTILEQYKIEKYSLFFLVKNFTKDS